MNFVKRVIDVVFPHPQESPPVLFKVLPLESTFSGLKQGIERLYDMDLQRADIIPFRRKIIGDFQLPTYFTDGLDDNSINDIQKMVQATNNALKTRWIKFEEKVKEHNKRCAYENDVFYITLLQVNKCIDSVGIRSQRWQHLECTLRRDFPDDFEDILDRLFLVAFECPVTGLSRQMQSLDGRLLRLMSYKNECRQKRGSKKSSMTWVIGDCIFHSCITKNSTTSNTRIDIEWTTIQLRGLVENNQCSFQTKENKVTSTSILKLKEEGLNDIPFDDIRTFFCLVASDHLTYHLRTTPFSAHTRDKVSR